MKGLISFLYYYYQYYFECLCVSVASSRGPLTVLAIYHPGSVSVTGLFFDEFSEVLKTVSTFNSQVLITGDFNIHVDLSNDIHADRLSSLISDYDLVQCVQEPTHVLGHTLDLVIVRSDCAISDLLVDPPSLTTD